MRTTLKRGVGRGAGANGNGNGRAKLPPAPPSVVTTYLQPPPPRRSGLGLFGRILLGVLLAALSIGAAIGGGAYLYFHQSVSSVQAHSKGVVKAEKSLDAVPSADQAAIALVIGYDHRANEAKGTPSLSDTLMLLRADPVSKTISMLSFPRDLSVPIYCSESVVPVAHDRINSAYSRCGEKGTVLTVKHLTGLPINFLITVNFHGFKEVVNQLGGVWMDVDRRYYNKNVGTAATNYANINLQPGYQRLDGGEALSFVRFRHTDSDLYRVARQQEFVRSFKEQVSQNFSWTSVPGIVGAIVHNIEVAEGGHRLLGGDQVLSYARFAFTLPHGHLFQDRFSNVNCPPVGVCTADPGDIQAAVRQFTNPDVGSSKTANAVALGKKVKPKTPPPASVTVTVLNGNGQAGAAANASYLLAQRGYKSLVPPNGLEANAPKRMFHSKIYYDPAQARSKAAATALQQLMQPADVAPLPRTPALLALDPGSMLMVVLGTTFSGQIQPLPPKVVPKHEVPHVRSDSAPGHELLDPLAKKVPFPLEVPTVLESSSEPDTQYGDTPVRLYTIAGKHRAVRMVFRTGGNQYWGIEETDWNSAPALQDKSFRHSLGGREFDLYYSGPRLHMIVLHEHGATYWVINTLLDDLSNETMLHIAQGLEPLTTAK
ncbi:MAG TPA: LCP family protein [Gaiellaceae bacterium]